MPDPTGRISHLPEMHREQGWKQPVRVATTANITLSGTQTIDGVAVIALDRVLVKNQTAASGNGIYTCAAGAWVRAHDMDQDASSTVPATEVMGAVVYVIAGTTNGGTIWKNTNTTAPTLGSTSLTFAQLTGSGAIALDDLSDVTITSATLADRLRFDGSVWRNSALIWRPITVFDPTTGNYLPLVDGSGNQIMAEA